MNIENAYILGVNARFAINHNWARPSTEKGALVGKEEMSSLSNVYLPVEGRRFLGGLENNYQIGLGIREILAIG